MTAGDRVHHLLYGLGTVVNSRHVGKRLQVAFDRGITFWLDAAHVSPEAGATLFRPSLRIQQEVHAPRSVAHDQFKARRLVEALRLGIVPEDWVSAFTYGREAEVASIDGWLKGPEKPAVMLARGAYGSGKSHLLDYTYVSARDQDYVVARVRLDRISVALDQPRKFYQAVAESLNFHVADGCGDFEHLVRQALREGLFRQHEHFQLLSRYDTEDMWKWAKGRTLGVSAAGDGRSVSVRLPPMPDSAKSGNIYCYLLSALGWAAQHLGRRGLFVLIDEAESVEHAGTSYRQGRGVRFLRALVAVANNDTRLRARACSANLVGLDLDVPGYTQGRFPWLFGDASGIKLLFAVPDNISWSIESELRGAEDLSVTPIDHESLRALFNHLWPIYGRAYQTTMNDELREFVFRRVLEVGGGTRSFVKGAVEALDLLRLHPEGHVGAMLR